MENQQKPLCTRNLFLIGFMGCGKSSVSDYLNQHYGMEKVEMDQVIAEQEGMPITEIFEKHGEAYFRSLESALLTKLREKEHTVVSCGGGTPMREENVVEMKKHGIVILLTASAQTIYDRVKDSHARPLLEGHMNVAYIADLMEQRREKYEAAADIVIHTDKKDLTAICSELAEQLMEWEKQTCRQ